MLNRNELVSRAVCCADSHGLNWLAWVGNGNSLQAYITGFFHAMCLSTPTEKELESFRIQLKEI